MAFQLEDEYESLLLARQQKYPVLKKPGQEIQAIVDILETNGIVIIKDAFEPQELISLGAELAPLFEDPSVTQPKVVDNTLYMTKIVQPLTKNNKLVKLATHSALEEIAMTYLKCAPGLASANVRKTFPHDGPLLGNQNFHVDRNSKRFIKFFFYLNDVDINGGPFTYVAGSSDQKFEDWDKHYNWPPDSIEKIYGVDRIIPATANVGDLIIANTTGFHRGMKPKTTPRTMITFNYMVHPESAAHTRFQVSKDAYENIPLERRYLLDFLEVTE